MSGVSLSLARLFQDRTYNSSTDSTIAAQGGSKTPGRSPTVVREPVQPNVFVYRGIRPSLKGSMERTCRLQTVSS